jgi:hypothetical protein
MVLAEDITAKDNLPPFKASVMVGTFYSIKWLFRMVMLSELRLLL